MTAKNLMMHQYASNINCFFTVMNIKSLPKIFKINEHISQNQLINTIEKDQSNFKYVNCRYKLKLDIIFEIKINP